MGKLANRKAQSLGLLLVGLSLLILPKPGPEHWLGWAMWVVTFAALAGALALAIVPGGDSRRSRKAFLE